jgi:hypothetical protein
VFGSASILPHPEGYVQKNVFLLDKSPQAARFG